MKCNCCDSRNQGTTASHWRAVYQISILRGFAFTCRQRERILFTLNFNTTYVQSGLHHFAGLGMNVNNKNRSLVPFQSSILHWSSYPDGHWLANCTSSICDVWNGAGECIPSEWRKTFACMSVCTYELNDVLVQLFKEEENTSFLLFNW